MANQTAAHQDAVQYFKDQFPGRFKNRGLCIKRIENSKKPKAEAERQIAWVISKGWASIKATEYVTEADIHKLWGRFTLSPFTLLTENRIRVMESTMDSAEDPTAAITRAQYDAEAKVLATVSKHEKAAVTWGASRGMQAVCDQIDLVIFFEAALSHHENGELKEQLKEAQGKLERFKRYGDMNAETPKPLSPSLLIKPKSVPLGETSPLVTANDGLRLFETDTQFDDE